MLRPSNYRALDTDAADPRFERLLGTALEDGETPRAALIGFPVDEGVRRNGGRPGAANGPAAIRQALARLTPDPRSGDGMLDLLTHTADLGDVRATGDLERDQAALAAAVAPLLRAGAFVIVLGGGHETAYGHFLGTVEAELAVELLNWDAHCDVRPLRDGRGHSGSPFRQALEHPSGACRGYSVAGVQPSSTAGAHLAYVRRHGRAVFADELTLVLRRELYALLTRPAVVSFDLDAVDQAWAPGVSAPATAGLDVATWLAAAREAGSCPAVVSCDIVELNPDHDRDGQTARLAARTVWEILFGLASRAA